MDCTVRHIALFVPDLQAAEEFYRRVFGMQPLMREAQLDDGEWYTLRPDKGWDDADAAEIELGMLALKRDDFVLALIRGDIPPGQVYAIGLRMSSGAIAEIRAGLPSSVQVETDEQSNLVFQDPYRITWQIHIDLEFQSTGEIAGRWLEV